MTETLFCYVHPTRETALRCNNCERPICVSCAVRTPTGYRCKECVRNRQKTFDTAEWYDYALGFGVAAFLSGVGAFLVTLIGGIGGEIAAWIAENCFGLLDAPVLRCASLDTPIPFNIELEQNFMAKGRLDETVQKLLNY